MKRVFAVLLLVLLPAVAWAQEKVHYLAVHVDQNDPKVMNIALNNVANVTKYYESRGEKVVIELVAYGPGLNMFVDGKSPVQDRISTMALEYDNLKFSACGNTLKKFEAKAGHKVPIVSEAEVVPSGVVRLMELQEQGYAYVRP